LEKGEGAQGPALGRGGWGLANVMAVSGTFLERFSYIAEIGAGEHVGAFRDAGDVRLVDIGGGSVDSFQRLERVGAVDEVAGFIRGGVEGVFGKAVAGFPGKAKGGFGLVGAGFERAVWGDVEGGCDSGEAKSGADIGVVEAAVFDRGEAGGDGKVVEIDIGA